MATKQEARIKSDAFLEAFPEWAGSEIRVGLEVGRNIAWYSVPRGPHGGLGKGILFHDAGSGTLYKFFEVGTILMKQTSGYYTSMVVLPNMETHRYLGYERETVFDSDDLARFWEWREQCGLFEPIPDWFFD